MSDSAWLVASTTYSLTFTVDATACAFAGPFTQYLRHATADLSLIDFVATRIVANVGGTCAITIQRDRRVRIEFNTARSVTWGSGTVMRDLLGFTGDLASAATHTATNVSPLLWSPGFEATPATRYGTDGYTVQHQSHYKSDDGSEVYVDHLGEEVWTELSWSHIMPDRMRVASTANGGGTFHEWYEQFAKLGNRFTWYESIDESDASTSDVTWTTARSAPYTLRPEAKRGNWYARNVSNAEVSCSLELPLQQLVELA